MTCAECRDLIVPLSENLLGEQDAVLCRSHLAACGACRSEFDAIAGLQQRLCARGQLAEDLSIAEAVMQRIRAVQAQKERPSIMNLIRSPWVLRLGTAAGVTALVVLALFSSVRPKVTAAEIIQRGARAVSKITSIHFRGQIRAEPQDNFSGISPDADLTSVELWKQFTPVLKWRIEKSGRVAAMDGDSTLLYIKSINHAVKVQASPSAFDTQWLHEIANLARALEAELQAIKAHNWPVSLRVENLPNGNSRSVVTVAATSGLSGSDYLKNKFFAAADTRRVYAFDNQTDLLESVHIFALTPAGEHLVFAVEEIDYNLLIDPATFILKLPDNVTWYQPPRTLPDNDRYASMTVQEAARAFFSACAREDWSEAERFCPWLSDPVKQMLGGLELISVGTPFSSDAVTTQFVPYEIRLKNSPIRRANLALRKDASTQRWVVDGGI